MKRLATLTLGGMLASALLLSACSGEKPPASLKPLRFAELTPGEGQGNLQLGLTTLETFLTMHPKGGRLSLLMGDETAVEVVFPVAHMAFLFEVPRACTDAVPARGLLRPLRNNPGVFFVEQPSCADARLQSIAVAADEEESKTFFKGEAMKGLKLHSPRSVVVETVGPRQRVSRRWLAGADPRDGQLEEHAHESGVVYFVGDAGGRLVVKKISIFLPEGKAGGEAGDE